MHQIFLSLLMVTFISCKTAPKGYETAFSARQNYPEAVMQKEGDRYVLRRSFTTVAKSLKPEGLRIYDAGVMGIQPEVRIVKVAGLLCDMKEGAIEEQSGQWTFKPRSEKATVNCYSKRSAQIIDFEVHYVLSRSEIKWSEINNDEREVLVRISDDLDQKVWSPGLLAWLDLFGLVDERQAVEYFDFKGNDSRTVVEFSESDYFEAIEFRATEGVQCEVRFKDGAESLDQVRKARLSFTGRDGKVVCTSSSAGSGWLRYLYLSNSSTSSWANSLSKNEDAIRETLQNRFNRKRWYGLYRSTQYVQVESSRSRELYRLGALSVVKAEQKRDLAKAKNFKPVDVANLKNDLGVELDKVKMRADNDPESDYFPMLLSVAGYPFLSSFQVKPTPWIWKGIDGETRLQDIRFKELAFDSEVTGVAKSKAAFRFKAWLYNLGVQGNRFTEDSILLSSLQKVEPRGNFKERTIPMCAKQARGIRQLLSQFTTDWDRSVQKTTTLANVKTESPYQWVETLMELKDDSTVCGLDFGFASYLYFKRTGRYHFCYMPQSYKKKGETKERLAWKPIRIEVDYLPLHGEAEWTEKKSIQSGSGHPFFKTKRVETDKKFSKGYVERCADVVSLFPDVPANGLPILHRR